MDQIENLFVPDPPSGDNSYRIPNTRFLSGTVLNTITVTNGDASEQDTTSFTSAFSMYEVRFENIVPGTNAVTLGLQVQVASAIQTTGYLANVYALNNIGAGGANQTTYIPLCFPGNLFNGSPGLSGSVRVSNPSSNVIHPWWGMTTSAHSTTSADTAWLGGYYNTAGAITGISVFASTGTLSSGKVFVVGIK